jgi:predicted DNA-binding transcriptional regulator AlpA
MDNVSGRQLIDMEEWARRQGVKVESVRRKRVEAERRRRENRSRPGDIPPADKMFGQSPAWYESTYEAWAASRPGRGAGGGRPPKNPQPQD